MNIQGFTPAMTAPVAAQAVTAQSTSQSSSASSGSGNGLSSGNLESTFLNLLVTELQNQDPTSPVDPTQMVGQMVSLNQLDQLISINQTLTTLAGSAAPAGTSPATVAAKPAMSSAPTTGVVSGASTPLAFMAPATAAQPAQPGLLNSTIPGGLMNLYGNIGPMTNTPNYVRTGGR